MDRGHGCCMQPRIVRTAESGYSPTCSLGIHAPRRHPWPGCGSGVWFGPNDHGLRAAEAFEPAPTCKWESRPRPRREGPGWGLSVRVGEGFQWSAGIQQRYSRARSSGRSTGAARIADGRHDPRGPSQPGRPASRRGNVSGVGTSPGHEHAPDRCPRASASAREPGEGRYGGTGAQRERARRFATPGSVLARRAAP